MKFEELINIMPNKVTKKWVKDNLDIKNYIPILDKYSEAKIISKVVLDYASDVDYKDNFETNFIYLKYDIFSTLTIFFKYISVEITDIEKTSANYDLIVSNGLYDSVLEYCSSDFSRFKTIVDRIVGIEDLSIYREISRVLNSDAYFERLEKSKKILNGVNLKKYEILRDINNFNNPLTKQVVDILKTSSVKDALSKQKEEDKNGEK